jgi:hypothetical protein
MTTKADLMTREAQCKSAADFATLAQAALALDADYAKTLLERAEAHCQMPADYLAAAEGAVAAGLTEYAGELYGQAEDACFDAMEKAALGASLARTGTDPAKGRALIEEAAGEAKKLGEFLVLSGYAKDALGDAALAASLLSKVEAQAKTLADYLDLARTLAAEGNPDAARAFYRKAERHLDGMTETVAYAKGYLDTFGDRDAARKVLDDAETDCQFPKDFAALASGYKALFEDGDKVAELMEQAAEFAMSGEEHLDLATGYWTLLGARDKAVAAYRKALPEVNDKGQLLELGGYIAAKVGDPALAKQFYAKAEERMSAAAERLKLAEAVIADTGDKAYAAEVYGRAADALTQPNDLLSVAAEVVDRLGETARATAIYRKAMAGMTDLGQHLKLLDAVAAKLDDPSFAREILVKSSELASGTPALLDLGKRALAVLGDRDMARAWFAKAEEQVTSVGEMKSLVAAVKADFAEDADWLAVVAEKLAKREANQEKYAVFQDAEKGANTAVKTLKLIDAMMAELDDRFYARKLLLDAQKKLDEEGWDFSKARKLVASVSQHLGDSDWAVKLLKDAADRVQGFANVVQIAESAAELLPDREQAKVLVRELLEDWERQLASLSARTAYDFSKLAAVKGRLLGDRDGAAAALEQAAEQAGSHFAFAELARVARDLGLEETGKTLLEQAAACCGSAGEARQLANRLLESGFGQEQVRALYMGIKGRMTAAAEQLQWTDGIVDLFGDRAWAGREFAELAGATQGADALRVQRRRLQRIEHLH